MARIIGIDLGTTNTAVAVMDQGRPRIIEDERGYRVLPSVISAKGDGRFVVGQAAHGLILSRPDRTVYGTKRLMGRHWDTAEVQALARRVRYQMREAADGGVEVLVGDQWMSPQEVAAVVLQVARSVAERALGEPVEQAVITVPAHFNHAQRKATLEAAELAGLRCDRLLNEPTSAALAYGHKKNLDRYLAVFDLGGGTFDVSVLHLQDGIYEILGTAGDTFLGGDDFDFRIVDFLADQFQHRHRVDLREDRNALQRLRDAAERAKCELSFSDRTNIVIPQIHGGEGLEATMTRAALESITGDLVDRCVEIARKAVQDAGMALSDIDEVLLVGGQTRMPKVREAVAGVFGRDPSRGVHPEEVVAIGAAVHGANLGDEAADRAVLLDVTPFDLGIDTSRGIFVPIVERNTRIPAAHARVFATVHDGQESVRVTVRQGESRNAAQNEFLGEFVLEGLTPAPAMQTKVDVTFRVDSNGLLHVSAVERGSNERRQITIRNYAEHAQHPHLPTAEEAAADQQARAKRAAAAPAAAVGPPPGTTQKLGILGRIFGGNRPAKPVAMAARPRPIEAAAGAPPRPEGVTPSLAAPLPQAPEALGEHTDASIPMDALAPVADLAREGSGDLIQEADLALPAEEALYEDFTNPRLATPTAVEAELDQFNGQLESGLDLDELFGGTGTEAADPFGVSGAPEAGANPFAADEPTRTATVSRPPSTPGVQLDDLFGRPARAPAPAQALDFDFTDSRVAVAARFGAVDPETQEEHTSPDPFGAPPRDEPSVPDLGLAATNDEPAGFALLEPIPPPTRETTESRGRTGDETTGGTSRRRRRPARIKLQYRDFDAFVSEYRENLRRGGTFIRTQRPLSVGRECVFEISAPGLNEPLVFPAVVTFVAAGAPGQDAGMGVEYQLDELDRRAIERVLSRA